MRLHRVPALALVAALLALALAVVPSAAQDEPPPATQLRLALDRVLSEHAFLIIEVMRLGVQGGEEYNAAADALDENTVELVTAIAGIYGDEAGDAVGVQWRNHIAFLTDYARALAEGDTAAAGVANDQLQVYVADFSALLAGAIPALPPEAVEGLIKEHVDQLAQVAEFDAEEFGRAYPAVRATYEHMFMIGDSLAVGISGQFPERFTGSQNAFSPATDLRITLDRLLGEHTSLASLAMRAGITEAPDAPSAVDALEENNAELADAIGSIYGDEAGTAFGELWTNHTDLYVDYVNATREGDTGAQDDAVGGLSHYHTDFTSFLAGANPYLSESEFDALIAEHTNQLVEQVDEYAAGDYAGAYAVGRDAFAHAGVISAALAHAIADQFPQRFPDTALEPTSAHANHDGALGLRVGLAVAAAATLGVLGVLAYRARRRSLG